MKWDIFIWCLVVCFHVKWTTSAFVTTPNNTVVLVGDRLTLNCSSSTRKGSYVRWYKGCDFCSSDAIAADNARPPYHTYSLKKGKSALVVSSVSMAEAGAYTCWDDIEDEGASLHVVVLAKHPKCRISSTNVFASDLVTMSCSVVYKGHLVPLMKWQTADGLTIASTSKSIQFGSAIRIAYTASVVAKSDSNGVRFQCTTYFDHLNSNLNRSADAMCNCDKKSVVLSTASNIPTYSYSWTSPALIVSSNRLPVFKESRQVRGKRATPQCSQDVYVGNEIVLGQDGLQCTWFVSTPTTSEHFVSNSSILVIDQAKMNTAGLYNCYVNGILTLGCQVNVIYNWGLGDHNICGVNDGQSFSCPTQASNDLAIRSSQSLYGFCSVTGTPVPNVRWLFCPDVCDTVFLSNVTDACQPVNDYNQNDTTSSEFTDTNVRQSGSGLYICSASYLDAVASIYNVCVNVATGDCSGTSVRWWHWYQAAVAIVTIDIIAAICFLVLVIVVWMDHETQITFCSRLLLIVFNHCVLLILAAMIIIGCAICLSRDSDSVVRKWETGVLVMFVLLFFFGILSAIVTALFKCRGNVHLIVVIVWDIVTILIALATLIWTLVNMSRCRSKQTSGYFGEWSWEVFLIALGIALFVCVLLALLWYIRRRKHCKCCGGTATYDCHFSSRYCCACCNHGSRERIRVGSGADINMQKGCLCCFCGCCKRKIGDHPQLGPHTHHIQGPQIPHVQGPQIHHIHGPQTPHIQGPQIHHHIEGPQTPHIEGPQIHHIPSPRIPHVQAEQRNIHGEIRVPTPERKPIDATISGPHYKRNDLHYQYRPTVWRCCAACSCCERRPKHTIEIERDELTIEQRRIRDGIREYATPTVWFCPCTRKTRGERAPISRTIDLDADVNYKHPDIPRNIRGEREPIDLDADVNYKHPDIPRVADRKRAEEPVRSHLDHHSAPTSWVCCAPRSCCRCPEIRTNIPRHEFEAAPVKWEMPDTSCASCCRQPYCLPCFTCCCSSCIGKGKRSEKKVDKKAETKNEKNKDKESKNQKEAKDHKAEKIKAEKEGRTKNGKDESDEEKNDKEKDHKKHGTNAHDDHDKHGDTDRKEGDPVHAKREDILLRGKVDKEPLLPPLFGSIELQEGSQRQVKRFLPPQRVLAESVLDDDRSLTPVTPGRDASPEKLGDSSKKSKKHNKIKEDDDREWKN